MVRRISLLAVSVLVMGLLAGCGNFRGGKDKDTGGSNLPVDENGDPSPFGKYEEPVTVEIVQSINPTIAMPEGDSVTDNYYTRFVSENLNVDISVKWSASSSDFHQKLDLAIASNDLPDIMVVSEQQFRRLAQSDMLEDLTPYYDTYACDVIKQNIDSTGGRAIENA